MPSFHYDTLEKPTNLDEMIEEIPDIEELKYYNAIICFTQATGAINWKSSLIYKHLILYQLDGTGIKSL